MLYVKINNSSSTFQSEILDFRELYDFEIKKQILRIELSNVQISFDELINSIPKEELLTVEVTDENNNVIHQASDYAPSRAEIQFTDKGKNFVIILEK